MIKEVGNGTGVYRGWKEPEAKITQKIIKRLKENFPGVIVVKLHGGGYQKAGLPDIVVMYQGITLWIEIKNPKSDTTKLQQKFLLRIIEQRGHAGIARSPDEAEEMLTMLLE